MKCTMGKPRNSAAIMNFPRYVIECDLKSKVLVNYIAFSLYTNCKFGSEGKTKGILH